MWIVMIAWMYVAVMMALSEATSTQGTVLGAIFTFLLYGLAPMALVMYLLSTPARRRALRAKEAMEHAKRTQTDQQEPSQEP
jgi:mannose/fructose/N-acetylgalactosamine-specific phosphotransferase system component IID